jgi:hypothetical protein
MFTQPACTRQPDRLVLGHADTRGTSNAVTQQLLWRTYQNRLVHSSECMRIVWSKFQLQRSKVGARTVLAAVP